MDDVREGFSRISSIAENLSGGMRTEKDTVHVILNHFNMLGQPLADFEKVIRNLNVLCNFIKIEIARLGLSDTSFLKLAEDVGRLAKLIEQLIKTLSDQAQSAILSLSRNIALIENCDARQKVQGKLILEKIDANLSAISQQNAQSSKTIHDISQTWQRISLNVGEVVQSLQFHDITRQRVEHTREALASLPQKLNTLKKEKGASSGVYRQTDLIADMFELQAAQLQNADHDLTGAVARIMQSLRFVAKDAMDISEKIISVTGQDGGRKDTFIVQMEKDVHALADSASDVARIKHDLTAAMSALSQTAMGMSVFVRDMEKIGIEMQRLALNARVHAAHLGEEGATLGVLAESIHQLSLETSSMVQKIMSCIQTVVENAAKLAELAGAGGSDQLVQVHEDFVTMLGPLKKIEEEIGALLPGIERSGVLLAGDIEHLLDGIHVHEKISSTLTKVATYLAATVHKMVTTRGKRAVREKTGFLEDLSKKYTMHSERATHMASMAGHVEKSNPVIAAVRTEKITPSPTAGISGAGGDELGDNVELF
jgi:methyl-accepting chemotaxis protein